MNQYKLYLSLFCLILSGALSAQPFTPGNIVVCRVGNGIIPMNVGESNPVFLDEYTPSGTLVRSIAMPTTVNGSNRALTLSGANVNNMGMITMSADGQYIGVMGYDAPVGTANIITTNPSTISRSIGLVKYDGLINTSTALNISISAGVVSAVSTNGFDIWCAVGGTSASRGIYYTTLGSSANVRLANPIGANCTLNIYQGQLYANPLGNQIQKVGTGLPTTAGQTLTPLGLPAPANFIQQYVFADLNAGIPGFDVIYVADEVVGITKYSFVGGVWVSNGVIGTDADDYRGLTATTSGGNVTLFATRKGGANTSTDDVNNGGRELVKLLDVSGYNTPISGLPVVIATALINTSFKGIVLAPQQAPNCSAPSSLFANDITPASAKISWNTINGITGYEYALTANATPPVSGTPITATSYTATGLTQGQTYYFHVRTNCGNFNTSSWSTVSFIPSCVAPPIITIKSVDNNANVKWNSISGAISYEYAISNSSTPPITGTATNDTDFVANNLSSVTQYYVHIRSNCGSGGYSQWKTSSFKTSCLSPVVSSVSNGDLKQFKWINVNGAMGYEYAITTYRTPPLGGTFLQDTIIQSSKFNAGTAYYFHIRTKCKESAGVSGWATVPFQTTGLDAYPNPVIDKLTVKVYGVTVNTAEIIIVDVMGRIVKKFTMTNSSQDIDVKDLAAGVYVVKYTDGINKYMVKVLKK